MAFNKPSPANKSWLFFLFFAWSILLTFPLIFHLLDHIPLGSEETGTVPFFNLWTLQWNIAQLLDGYPAYWDAPIFFPSTGAFAFSEIQPASAILAAPIWLGWQSPGLAYNALVLLFLTLNGWFAFWLLRLWGVTARPALLAGLMAQSIPFVAQEMGVLQLLALFGFLWPLLFLNRFLIRPNQANGLGLLLGLPVAFFSCGYYGLFSLIFLPLALLILLQGRRLARRTVGWLLTIGILSLALVLPSLLKQKSILDAYNLTRSEQTIQANSARLIDFGQTLDHNLLYGQILGLQSNDSQRFFPGLGLLLLAGLGLFHYRKQPAIKTYLLLASVLALTLAFGPALRQPYQLLKDLIPGFAHLRSPFRFVAFIQLHLVLLAGLGLDNLWSWAGQRRPIACLIPALLAAFALFEMLALPLPLLPLPNMPQNQSWQAWLSQQTAAPHIVLIPFAAGPRAADFEQTTRWMLDAGRFPGKMANGYSGFFPPGHANLRETLAEFPAPASLDVLRDYQVDYVVIYHALSDAPQAEQVESRLPRLFYDAETQVGVYHLRQ
jgi:hypothetical protein